MANPVPCKSTSSLVRGEPPSCLLGSRVYLFYKIAQFVEEQSNTFFESQQMRPRQFAILRLIQEKGVMTQQQICEALWIDRASMVKVMKDLMQMGLVARQSNKQDRRSLTVKLTPKGLRTYQQTSPIYDKFEDDLFPNLKKQESKDLIQILRQVLDQIPRTQGTGPT